MLNLRDIGFTFADNQVHALAGVSLRLTPGRIHAIIGENGAGKSTLARICTGHLQPAGGSLELAGTRVSLADPAQALAHGLALVPQHPRLAGDLAVWQNLMLGRSACRQVQGRFGRMRKKAVLRELRERLQDWHIHVPLEMPARLLDAAHMHWAAIAEALLAGPRALFLDEPSAPYTPEEVQRLYQLLGRCAAAGMMVAVITHRLPEVLEWADEVHVLRGGRLVSQFAVSPGTGLDDLLAPMFAGAQQAAADGDAGFLAPSGEGGSPAPGDAAEARPGSAGSRPGRLLAAHGVSVRQGPGRQLDGLSFSAPPGQITGLVGIKDQGLEVLEDLLSGMVHADSGRVSFGDRPLSSLQRHEFAYIPGKRFVRGIATTLSIRDNLVSRQRRELYPGGFLSPSRLDRWLTGSTLRFGPDADGGLAGPAGDRPVTTLSGGMIQRLIFERELANPQPGLVICAEPWWGLDQRYQSLLLARLKSMAASGRTVVVLSSDLDEAMACCDRLLVIRHGRAGLTLEKSGFDRPRLAQAMVFSQEAGT